VELQGFTLNRDAHHVQLPFIFDPPAAFELD
jgi:hypothetical protein